MIPAYVINLVRARERRAWMEGELARVGLAANFIAAVDGREFAPKCKAGLAERAMQYRLSPSEAALILSHRKVWRAFLAGGASHALVLEDDVHLGGDFAALLEVDWSQWSFDAVKLETYGTWTWLSRRRWPLAERELSRLGSRHYGSAAYIVSAAGARKLLRRSRSAFEPVDLMLFGAGAYSSGAMEALQLSPAAAIQDSVRRAGAAALPSYLESTRGAPASAPMPRPFTFSGRLKREAARIVLHAYHAFRRLKWRWMIVPFA